MTTTTFDLTALTAAIESRDADAQLGFYAPNAELVLVDRDNPPSRPRTITGTDQLRTHLTDVCQRDMTHSVRAAIVDGDHIAAEVACAYPDGTRVLCMCVAELHDGRIVRQHQVQAWDA
jgi:ketosteroid isomerase-like protein